MTEQERNLQIVKGVALAAAAGMAVVLLLLYYGHELPFYEMRRQHTDATGYAPPPRSAAVTGAGIPRVIDLVPGRPQLGPSLPNLPNGAIPAQAVALRNPLASSRAARALGRSIYDVNCSHCHGGGGRGDGLVGASYVPAPPDLTGAATRALSDGALYYTITNGILSTPVPTAGRYLPREWHAYQSILTTRERWSAVVYVRSLEAKRATP